MIFSREVPNMSPSTGQAAPTVTTISGDGVIVSSDPRQYAGMDLTESIPLTILFTPDDYPLLAITDEFVKEGDTTIINGRTLTVKRVFVTAPDGFVIVARILVVG